VAAGGKVLMVAAPHDAMTLLHHAEHLARIPGKRVRRVETPFAAPGGTCWRMVEEFDTSQPVVSGLADDYFADVVRAFLATGQGAQGRVGEAPSLLVDAAAICAFAVEWLEQRAGVRVRAARADDLEAAGALKLRASLAWGDHIEQLLALPEAQTAPAEHLPSMFVAEVGGRLAGFATVLLRDDGDAELEDLFVEPDLWRHGIATGLVAEAERRAGALGARRLHVVGSARAQAFYEARGFELVGQAQTLFAPAPVLRKMLA
jgi:N-acetylglutamate synthase-like GNAT family acetyltransferase